MRGSAGALGRVRLEGGELFIGAAGLGWRKRRGAISAHACEPVRLGCGGGHARALCGLRELRRR